MSLDAAQSDSQVLSSVDDLVGWFRGCEKRPGERRVGLEHEKLLYDVSTGGPVPYEGPRGIGALFTALERFGWKPFREAEGKPAIALTRGEETLSLEPGGQLELSGAPHPTAAAGASENLRHVRELEQAAGPLGIGAAALGYRPFGTLADQPWMPKRRYQVMRETLGERGPLAHDMMLMTATGQVSLDWVGEPDCAQMVTLLCRAAPLFVGLFANSPLKAGQPTGFHSWRSRVWAQVDPARTGYVPHALDGEFTYRSYVEWALDAPLLFLRRGGRYLTPRLTFRELLASGFDGLPARESDWADHLSTLFPEVRLKRVVEFRSADCGTPQVTGALAAALRGLCYEATAREEALALLPARPLEAHLALHVEAARLGLGAVDRGRPLARWCVDLLGVARRGLERLGDGDAPLLAPLQEVAESGHSPAERVLAARGDALSTMRASSLWG